MVQCNCKNELRILMNRQIFMWFHQIINLEKFLVIGKCKLIIAKAVNDVHMQVGK